MLTDSHFSISINWTLLSRIFNKKISKFWQVLFEFEKNQKLLPQPLKYGFTHASSLHKIPCCLLNTELHYVSSSGHVSMQMVNKHCTTLTECNLITATQLHETDSM